MEKHFKWLLVFIILTFLSACNTTVQQNALESIEESESKTFNVAFTWSPANLDPHGSEGWEVMRAGIAETLIMLDENLEPSPWLAKNWEQEDSQTFILYLQENVLFHNGTKMNAERVKASLERSLEMNQRAKDLLQLDLIEVLDDHSLKLVTKEPNAALIAHLADPSTIIADVSVIDDNINSPVLTGAFTVKQFQKDEFLLVERFKEYWGEPSLIDEITIRFISDGNTRLMALQAGEVDAATDIPIDNIPVIERDKNIEILTASSLRTHMMLYNFNSPIFEEPLHRQAIDSSILKEEIVQSVMMGKGAVANSPFADVLPFGSINSSEERLSLPSILKEAGWVREETGNWMKGGEPFEITMLTFPQRPELTVMAEIIQNTLHQEGILVHLKQVENIDEALKTEHWDMAMYSMLTAHTGDPQYFLNIFYHSNSPSNVSNYQSAAIDELIEEINRTSDQDKRNTLALEMQNMINEDLPQSFIVYPETVFGARSNVSGFNPHPIEYYYIRPGIKVE
ncbi:ABC transporter substrate-binding protein [Alkalihalophilus marmarensis]|uniref:Solute-binding protein family 5 domain-containing protein n=1 Tax=Alkalihalophilus marmarensis DSM 21297 TaxID=1188261 RepID=U6SLD0_9BACI|nr:ABC transporter substrate-binding protein [Alkalihalophilus marmarensis]ERN51426.1 hypothetical protein A33I_01760 [Alkalihalophilus marmarensis DSM 21297]MCM3490361.1 ABC transporter substrate-binding protein [Alkalihalophilus marmarensis]